MNETKQLEDKYQAFINSNPRLKSQHDYLFNNFQNSKRRYLEFRDNIIKENKLEMTTEIERAKKFIRDKILSDSEKVITLKKMVQSQEELDKSLELTFKSLEVKDHDSFFKRAQERYESLMREHVHKCQQLRIPFFKDPSKTHLRNILILYIQEEIEEIYEPY
ncbi:hypothetical protein WICMUC_002525 [Wickerhamomyces mucosus]|uniref:Uncharacterized protein n=1 Tax=Wickerhamomyces mucosus TaxID=1378264 RepID=A0A9P8PNY3_9ASCO|nr:hypothetical protein WICMUC_002525 [Wickerhamomyces mucosus]